MGTSGASSSGSGAAALPGSSRGTQVALGCIVALELIVSTGLVLLPLRDRLSDLGHLKGWTSQYSVSLSDLDVWVLSIVKCGALLLLLALAPSLASAGRYTSDPPVHKQLRQAASLICTIVQLLLLSKAVVVAVSAPDDVWPTAADPDQPLFVGLANMFSCLGVCLLASFIEGPLVRSLLRDMQDTYEAAAERASTSAANGLTEPLLPSSKKVPDEEEGAGKPTPAESAAKARADKSVAVRRAIGQLVSLSLPDTPINVAAFLAGSVAALATALVPYYTGLVIDYASIEPDRAKFSATIVRLVWVSALCGVFTGIRGGLFTLSMTRLNVRIRRRLFHALVQMEMGFFDKNKTGDITSRLSSDTNSASDQITLCMNVTMRSITQAVLVLVFMLYASWRLTTVTFIMIPFIMAISSVYGKYYSALTKRVRTELADANAEAEEVLGSMATIKAHAAQESSEVAYGRKLDSYFALNTQAAAAYAGYACLYTFLPSAVSAVVLFYGGNLVLQGKMSPGSLVSFMLYQQSLSGAFQSMADVFSGLMAAVGAADKVLELMNRTPEVSTSGSLIPTTFSGRIEFRDVIFHYPARPEQPVLRGLSLLVNPGEVVALVGPSGGGKSSIVKLVERFYLPHSGAVLVDGRDLGVYNNKWLRRQVALVSQEPVLYARSIRRNIIYGLEPEDGEPSPPSMEEVVEAAKQANAHDFVSHFPEGYETNCGEKGAQMSGGQKQRIAIARALVRKPKVLLLDEATSALDADSEAVVQEALDRMMTDRTTLVIAHRLSTIQHADKIIVVAKGAVQEVGSHDELLSRNGVYATLVRRQLQRTQSTATMGLSRDVSSANLPVCTEE